MDSIEIPDGLPDLVAERFRKAKESGELLSFDTTAAVLDVNGIPFQLLYCPSLKSKPKAPPNNSPSPSTKPLNPFLTPPPALFITPIGPTHNLLLNKFAVTPNHSILATKSFAPQTGLLTAADLGATYALLAAYRRAGHRLFGFFNCGPHSGASQPHRHIQFLPVESMRAGLSEGEWEILADKLGEVQGRLPFTYFSAPIKEGVTPEELLETYLALYNLASYAVETYRARCPGEGDKEEGGMSYNLAFTEAAMVILPRRAEGMAVLTGREEPRETGVVSLNGAVLGGTLLVKDELEWEALRGGGERLKGVLERIGIPFSVFQGEIMGWKGSTAQI